MKRAWALTVAALACALAAAVGFAPASASAATATTPVAPPADSGATTPPADSGTTTTPPADPGTPAAPEKPALPTAADRTLAKVAAPTATLAWDATPLRTVSATSAPGGGKALASVGPRTPFWGGPDVLLVVDRARMANGVAYVKVRLKQMPAGSSGWIPASAVRLKTTNRRVIVDLNARTLTLQVAGRTVLRSPVVVGKTSTPTPIGLFAVDAPVDQPSGSDLGPRVLALDAYSRALAHYQGSVPHRRSKDRLMKPSLSPLGSSRGRGGLAAILLGAAVFGAVPAAASADTQSFTDAGCHLWTVPDGVTSVAVAAQGADGSHPDGGRGALISGTYDVTPGAGLYACVNMGAGAIDADDGDPRFAGGYSSFGTGQDIDSAVIVAGGGGAPGAWTTIADDPTDVHGGDAGLVFSGGQAGNGDAASVTPFAVDGGAGASPTAGGAFGVNDWADGGTLQGGAGGHGQGGYGGAPGEGEGRSSGGPGGGGWYGGGGGAGGASQEGAGGGGGGSSLCDDVVAECQGELQSIFITTTPGVTLTYTVAQSTTTSITVNPDPVKENTSVEYRATVSPVPDGGHVDFTVNEAIVCSDVPIDSETGVATCSPNAPFSTGPDNQVTATYSGDTGFQTSNNSATFTVTAPRGSINPSPVDFGSVTVGQRASRTVTFTNTGDADYTLDSDEPVMLSAPVVDSLPEADAAFTLVSTTCEAGGTIPARGTCTADVSFAPTATGARTAEIWLRGDGTVTASITGNGVAAARTDPGNGDQGDTNTNTNTDPTPPPASTDTTPAPAPPVNDPAPAPPAPAPVARGATLATGGGKTATVPVSQSGTTTLPLACPNDQTCTVSGTLTLTVTAGSASAKASAAAAHTTVLARFSGIKVAAHKTRKLTLRLPAAFIKKEQAKGVRKLRTTLTVVTTLGSGRKVTSRHAVTLTIPRASVTRTAPRQKPKPKVKPQFTG